MLLESNVEVNSVDPEGRSMLIKAATQGNAEIVEVLLRWKANVNLPETASSSTPLHVASSAQVAQLLLADGQASLDAIDSKGRTPLLTAAAEGDTQLATLLIEHRSDVSAKDSQGRTGLHMIGQGGGMGIVQVLVNAKIDVLARDQEYRPGWFAALAATKKPKLTKQEEMKIGSAGKLMETPFPSIDALVKVLELGEEDTVFDLGSGRGSLAIHVRCTSKVKEVVGVELVRARFEAGMSALELLETNSSAALCKSGLRFLHSDFTEIDVSKATVVFALSRQFANDAWRDIVPKIAGLPVGVRLVTRIEIDEFMPKDPGAVQMLSHNTWFQLPRKAIMKDWGSSYHVYTVVSRTAGSAKKGPLEPTPLDADFG
eukprot:gnl/MRDRNA2_/MRDRNA2_226946_c0_seq1.p1 gnl/MRDRNA2_/MRDRNA2_226946_c0~~gnl/MRDRNA2_/MRDRNA2_226946_c0_seq1.p1  ORF type:complete len:403 (+),score=85.93 gnl/MRDRNA2_/MRDRNA2_226946_c0_seq1:95-1210(+)